MSAIALAPLTAERLGELESIVSDPDVLRFTRVPDPPPPDFLQSWFAVYEEARRQGTRELFAVLDDDGRILGVAVAPEIDRAARTAELGYVVLPEARGRGVATAALQLLTEWAFTELGMERLVLLISVENEASKAVAARCGYVREGVLRSAHFKGDLREDTEIWSRLPSDP